MKSHSPDQHGAPPLDGSGRSHTSAVAGGPGDVFGTTGQGPGAHGIEGLAEPHKFGAVAPNRNAGSHVAQTKGSPSADHSAQVDKRGTLGGETKDTVKRTK